MAITLDELLNRNRHVETNTQDYEQFSTTENNREYVPTYEELKHNNADNRLPKFENYNYQEDSAQSQSLYEFTKKDNDRLSQQELYARIMHQNDGKRPVFNKEEETTEQKHGVFAYSEVNKEEKVETKKRFHLNLKGKLIVAAYVAVVAAVAGLIIANSSNLNAGKAVTPSSSVSDYAIVEIVK